MPDCNNKNLLHVHDLESLSTDLLMNITNGHLQDGDTPLMRAVRNRHELIVRQLLDKGARVAAFDKVCAHGIIQGINRKR